MRRSLAAALVLTFGLATVPTFAADKDAATPAGASTTSALAGDVDWSLPPVELTRSVTTGRGAALPALYAGLATLNIFDAVTTSKGLSHGAVESNALMAPIAKSSAALWIAKGAATATSIAFAERLWKSHHRAQAIAVMVAANGFMAAVAARNASVLRHQAIR